jgi:glycosyltransferase involved in cell wall biosynthesis
MYKGKKISLVIPAYNERKLIQTTLENVPDVIDKIYVVDDGSTDGMAEVVQDCMAADERIELIQHERNMGVGQALITGYQKSSAENYDIAVVVGGDNQMALDEVSNFLDPLVEKTVDYTKGNRFLFFDATKEKMPKIRLIGNIIITALTKISSGFYKVVDVVDGYTAITKRAIDVIDWEKAWKGYGYPMDFLIRLNAYGFKVKDVPRRPIYLNGVRQSQIKGLRYAFKVSPMLIRGFFWRLTVKYIYRDFHPLVFFYFFGLLLLPLGILFGLYLIYSKITGTGVTGPTAILCALLIITGLQFMLFAMFFDMEESHD